MTALALCVLAFIVCLWAGKRSLGQGLLALFVVGFFYGILRANVMSSLSHFIFDAGLVGLYCSVRWRSGPADKDSRVLTRWCLLLMLWPLLLLCIPLQPWMVSLVGFRGAVLFVPALILGSRLKSKDIIELSTGIAILDLIELAFAGAEYVLGVPRFFPPSAVTSIMYASGDVAGGYLRIPGTFSSAAAFGGMMVSTMPYLIGLWSSATSRLLRLLGLISLPAAMIGVLMSATRSNFLFGSLLLLFAIFKIKMSGKQKTIFLLVIAAVGYVALHNARFQRFKSLKDTDYVSERIAGSVNHGFFEILGDYPMGNGLGGGGTSMPYFLEGQVRNPISMENEYARILAEQGVIGFLLWVSFVFWLFSRAPLAFSKGPWATSRRLIWCLTLIGFGTAWIGTGLLTAIPGTALLLLGAGWVAVPPEASPLQVRRRSPIRVAVPVAVSR